MSEEKEKKTGLHLLLTVETKARFDELAERIGIPTTAWIVMAAYEKLGRDRWIMEEVKNTWIMGEVKNTVSEKEAVAKEGADGEEAN